MNTPERARVSGSMASKSSPSYSTSPRVTWYSGCPASTRANVLLPDPFGPMMACTVPGSIDKSIPRRISRPAAPACKSLTLSITSPHAAFERYAQQLLCFHCELHWQLPEHFLAEAADDQVDRVFRRNAAAAAVEDLVLPDFRRGGFVFDAGRAVLDIEIRECVGAALIADEQRAALRVVTRTASAFPNPHDHAVSILAMSCRCAL